MNDPKCVVNSAELNSNISPSVCLVSCRRSNSEQLVGGKRSSHGSDKILC